MPLVYGSTTIQEVIYNGVNLDKIYYGTTLVFTKAKIFSGGNGQSVFDITVGYNRGSAVYSDNTTYSNCDASTMTGNVYWGSSGSSYISGWVITRTKSSYDITQYTNATFNVTSWSDYNKYGTQHTCFVYGVRGSKSAQVTGGFDRGTEVDDVVVSLSDAKSKGDTASFGWQMQLYRSSGTLSSWTHGQLNSIILS